MAFEALLDTDEERQGRRLIQQAGTILTGLHGDMPESFATQLFARGAPEDLVRYEARDLATLAEDAWRFLKQRRPGTPKVRCDARGGPPGAERIKAISIIEIVNDNMPFLLDSVMGELTERGIEVHLVVHPILTIERDTGGMLVGFRGEAPANGTALRESFIHIHIERIDDAQRRAEIVQAIEQVLADVRLCVDDWRPMREREAPSARRVPSSRPRAEPLARKRPATFRQARPSRTPVAANRRHSGWDRLRRSGEWPWGAGVRIRLDAR